MYGGEGTCPTGKRRPLMRFAQAREMFGRRGGLMPAQRQTRASSEEAWIRYVLVFVVSMLAIGLLRHAGDASRKKPPEDAGPQGDVEQGRWSVHPSGPVQVGVFLAAAVTVFLLLSWRASGSDLVESRAWLVWRVTAALGVALSIIFGYRGIAALLRLPRAVQAVTPHRTKWGFVVAAGLLTAGVVVFRIATADVERTWPIENMETRLLLVSGSVGATAIPWVAVSLLAGRALMWWDYRRPIWEVLQVWDLVMAAVLAFAVYVVVALVPTGALRSVWLSQLPKNEARDEQFPASDVLLYGTFLAVILAALTLPVLAAWVHKANQVADAHCPLPDAKGLKTEEWHADRSRLEKTLHLDIGLLKNPLTAFTVLTPLVTSALAAFIPQLASKA